MSKKILAITLSLMILLTGCGGKSDAKVKALDMDAFFEGVGGLVEEGDEIIEAPQNAVSDFYSVDFEKIESCRVMISATSATATEIAVFQLKDASYMETLKKAVEIRLEDKKDSFRDYIPAEMTKLDGAVIETNGNYLMFACVTNGDDAKKLFADNLK